MTDMHPDFPVVTGDYPMTKGWHIALPLEFNRRIDEDSLVLWRPDLTFWINVWHSEGKVAMADILERLRAEASPARTGEQVDTTDAMIRLTYDLAEDDSERADADSSSINGFVIVPTGYVQISAYYDAPDARVLAGQIIRSIAADS